MKKIWYYWLVFVLATAIVAGCRPGEQAAPVGTPTAAPVGPTVAAPKPVPGEQKETPRPSLAPASRDAPASQGKPYYEGKTIEFLVTAPAGGGDDAIARILAGVWPRYIPGSPRLIVRNQPGASGVIANNSFYEKAKPDGLTLALYSSTPIAMQQRGRDVVKYDLTRYRHIGNVSRAQNIIFVRKGQKGRLTDPRAQPVVIGSREGEESWQSMTLWGKEYLGWNVRWVTGYPGTNEMELAIRRGELDMFGTSNAFVIRRLLQEGVIETVSATGSYKGGKFLRRVDFPDVPTFEEILGDKKPGGTEWQAFIAWIGPGLLDKPIAAPPGTPDAVMNILIEAFTRAIQDSQFDELTKRMISEVYTIGIGPETDSLIKQLLTVPPEALKFMTDLQVKAGLVSK